MKFAAANFPGRFQSMISSKMKFKLLSLILLLLLLLLVPIEGLTIVGPQRIWRKQAPLQESLQLLVARNAEAAAQLWNETKQEIYDHAELVHNAQLRMDAYQQQINERVEQFYGNQMTDTFHKCFEQYEREVARFNRELLSLYKSCKRSLNKVLTDFERQIAEEANFLNVAAVHIEQLIKNCNVTKLRRQSVNQQAIVLCTVAGVGSVNHRLATSAELCVDMMLELSVNALDTQSCQGYQQLQAQFHEVHESIEACEVNQ